VLLALKHRALHWLSYVGRRGRSHLTGTRCACVTRPDGPASAQCLDHGDLFLFSPLVLLLASPSSTRSGSSWPFNCRSTVRGHTKKASGPSPYGSLLASAFLSVGDSRRRFLASRCVRESVISVFSSRLSRFCLSTTPFRLPLTLLADLSFFFSPSPGVVSLDRHITSSSESIYHRNSLASTHCRYVARFG